MYKQECDILKGIMIIFVVVGHCKGGLKPYFDVFWFHMPAFFLLSGFLNSRWNFNKQSFVKNIKRLVIPYVSYSIMFFCLMHPEPLFKNILRTVYAGSYNITSYSYPYWFINTLFVAVMLYGGLKQIVRGWEVFAILVVVWLVVHIEKIVQLRWIPLPWGIDNALGAIVFIYLGDLFKRYKFRLWHISFCILPIVFWLYCQYTGFEYEINMKSMTYQHILLDFLVPCLFTYMFYLLSLILCRVRILSDVLTYVGKCSITIFFVHAFFLGIYKDLFMPLAVVVSIVSSCLVHYTFNSNKYIKALFIGR